MNKWFKSLDFTKQPLMGGSAYVVFYTHITEEAVNLLGKIHDNGSILLNNIAILENYGKIIGYVDVQDDMFIVKVIASVNKTIDGDVIEQAVKEFAGTVSSLLDEVTATTDSIKVYRHGMLPIPRGYEDSKVKEVDIVFNNGAKTISYVYELTEAGFETISKNLPAFKKVINPTNLKCENAYLFNNIKSVVAEYKSEECNFYIVDGIKDIINLFVDYSTNLNSMFSTIYKSFEKKEEPKENE